MEQDVKGAVMNSFHKLVNAHEVHLHFEDVKDEKVLAGESCDKEQIEIED